MAERTSLELSFHLAFDAEARRWYTVNSDLPGLNLEADDPATLIRRVEIAAAELIELNGDEMKERFGLRGGETVRLTPIFDSPIELAA